MSNEIIQFSLLSKFACEAQIVSSGKLKAGAGKILPSDVIAQLFTEVYAQRLFAQFSV